MDAMEKWLAEHAIECGAYSARISREACTAYQAGRYVDGGVLIKPTFCVGCANAAADPPAPARRQRRMAMSLKVGKGTGKPALPVTEEGPAIEAPSVPAAAAVDAAPAPRPRRASRRPSARRKEAAADLASAIVRELVRLAARGHRASRYLLERIR